MDGIKNTRKNKSYALFEQDNPQWIELALKAVNKWGKGEVFLQQAVGEALKEAWEMGASGVLPPISQDAAPKRLVRVSAPEPQKTPEGTTIRLVRRVEKPTMNRRFR